MNNTDPTALKKARMAGGFTLLEIMVAIFIFAVIITTVFGSFRVVFSSADAVGGDVAVFETARICLTRMAEDLGSLVITDYPRYTKPEFNEEEQEDIYRLVGDTTDVAGSSFSRLRFASLAHLPLNQDPRQGVCRIVYYVDEGVDDQLVVRRADHLYPFPEFEESPDDPVLCDNVLALEFEYMDEEGEIIDRWDSQSSDNKYATPRLIEIRLTTGSQDRSRTFSTRVRLHVFRKAVET
ncbi:putative general secretion pathway protein J [Desulfosarcina variabilis str. Montpellier]|uniref:type II secretion system protein GspJ n=1 Tax=Desulfosarcina variabilis TaxID=2300 RepID=UPI003AFA8A32